MSSAELARTYKLPLLPGNSTGEEMLRRNFRKQQTFTVAAEGRLERKAIPVDFDSTGVVDSVKKTSTSETNTSLDRKVLRFFGYYKEAVHESALERERMRKVVLCYFLEDDTVSVSEPRQDNSGIAFQGTLVKRHQIPTATGNGILTFDQLAVGRDISIYGRTMHICDCDAFSREFMSSIGTVMAEPEAYPGDSYSDTRFKPREKTANPDGTMQSTLNSAGMKVKLSAGEIRATKQFLQSDRQVLRFEAVWDDRSSLYGELRRFNVYYFLSDDTIEVTEVHGVNSGHDPFPSFVRRQKCIKPRGTRFENTTSSLTFTKGSNSGSEYYTDADMSVGQTLYLFGREFKLCSCDKFTQDHLKAKYGVTDFTPIEVAVQAPPQPKREPPPHNGFGDEEDSLGSWRSLALKPPRRDIRKFMANVNNVVKFSLKLDNNEPTDEVRRFVLTFYLADDTLSIFEPVQRNSGIVGGKFLQRQKVRNVLNNNEYFKAADFFVGAKLVVNGFPFVVQATDERSMVYMESNSKEFDKANINAIIRKMQAMLLSGPSGLYQALCDADANGVPFEVATFAEVFTKLSLPITEHECLTVMRHFDRNGEGNITFTTFADRVWPGEGNGDDSRSWEEIHAELCSDDATGTIVKSKVETRQTKILNTTAAYAARSLSEQYNSRRQLFNSAFRSICDYSTDGKIGEAEFREVITNKLKADISPQQLDALCSKLFPPGVRRVTFEELVRLLQGNSNHSTNLTQLQSQR